MVNMILLVQINYQKSKNSRMLAKILLAFIAAFVIGWLIYEFKRAPYLDDNGNFIDKNKKD